MLMSYHLSTAVYSASGPATVSVHTTQSCTQWSCTDYLLEKLYKCTVALYKFVYYYYYYYYYYYCTSDVSC